MSINVALALSLAGLDIALVDADPKTPCSVPSSIWGRRFGRRP